MNDIDLSKRKVYNIYHTYRANHNDDIVGAQIRMIQDS